MSVNDFYVEEDFIARAAEPRCPGCRAADGMMTLLTSMTRYYLCGRCERRWQISRTGERPAGVRAAVV